MLRLRALRYSPQVRSLPRASGTLSYKHCPRRFSTEPQPQTRSKIWIATVSCGVLGAAALAYAGWDAYSNWRNLYPVEVRVDLKRGISAKNNGDLETSAYYKRKAWDTAKTLPLEVFKTEPYLKITGIAVDLAGELEEDGKPQEAFGLYSDALDLIRNASHEHLSGKERLRSVSLAVKLGQLAEPCGVPVEEEEKVLVFAVEEVLKLLLDNREDNSQPLDFLKLKLPSWLSKTDVGVPLQELGDFYGRAGKLEYAIPLYIQGISLLIPEDGTKHPPEDLCQGAQLMNNIAELLVRGNITPERRAQAETWAQKALSLLSSARKNTKEQISTCELALCAALFNAGMLREVSGRGDEERARSFFTAAFQQSSSFGVDEGVAAAKEAIERLNSKQP
ncbi:hypothetical protein MSAN_01557600 [Mycena sanguinolenta]|uniref:Uncharacterized protein n=1 Tax=Mycena sanguinolenta TaxID=230812 RepID=A0A8H6Y3F6_9AGAR|nr:hypothetical protein MSAN_01557600 [Mycena sanguinolenta]